MSDELQQNDEQQRKRISGRKKKVENFNLNIDFSNSDDDMFLPDDTDRDILDVNIREDDDFVPPKRTTDIEFDEQAVDEEKQRRRSTVLYPSSAKDTHGIHVQKENTEFLCAHGNRGSCRVWWTLSVATLSC